MARRLHEQSGGDPSAQGPVPELANEPMAPHASHDFPDTPPGNRPREGDSDLTDEQLADFAARLGLADDPGPADADPDSDPEPGVARPATAASGDRCVRVRVDLVRQPAARVLVVVGRVVTTAGARMRSAGERLESR